MTGIEAMASSGSPQASDLALGSSGRCVTLSSPCSIRPGQKDWGNKRNRRAPIFMRCPSTVSTGNSCIHEQFVYPRATRVSTGNSRPNLKPLWVTLEDRQWSTYVQRVMAWWLIRRLLKLGTVAFVSIWRAMFVDAPQPAFLPPGWDCQWGRATHYWSFNPERTEPMIMEFPWN